MEVRSKKNGQQPPWSEALILHTGKKINNLKYLGINVDEMST